MPRLSTSDHASCTVGLALVFRCNNGYYRVFAPGHLPLETMGHLGVRPPGDSLLVPGRWFPPHERRLLKAVEPIMDT